MTDFLFSCLNEFFAKNLAMQTIVNSWTTICQTMMNAEDYWWQDNNQSSNDLEHPIDRNNDPSDDVPATTISSDGTNDQDPTNDWVIQCNEDHYGDTSAIRTKQNETIKATTTKTAAKEIVLVDLQAGNNSTQTDVDDSDSEYSFND